MKKNWCLAYPRQGHWFHVDDIIQAENICKIVEKYLHAHDIKINTVWAGGSNSRVVDVYQQIKSLFWHLRGKTGCKLKLRMFIKEKAT